MQGFLPLGLLVGVTGLGVVMVRAVRERRRTIGILGALGFRARTVQRSFLWESAFIAVEGIVLGSLLGVLTTWLTYRNSAAFEGREGGFPIEGASIGGHGGRDLRRLTPGHHRSGTPRGRDPPCSRRPRRRVTAAAATGGAQPPGGRPRQPRRRNPAATAQARHASRTASVALPRRTGTGGAGRPWWPGGGGAYL
ncbi:FtsX-like permease family protein [Streptomyces sp. NPDC057116]|uniref:FtsX-like permease family protein n=1 Tax=Streptomyces sp. NPDC057116 TaxID=3346023 RepID=UPI00364399C0